MNTRIAATVARWLATAAVTLAPAGCYKVETTTLAPGADAGSDSDADSDADADADSDTDSDSDSDADPECGSPEWPDMDDLFDCPIQSAWPCRCSGNEGDLCDNGLPCLGAGFETGMCASSCQVEDPPTCPEIGPFGIDVVEICDTYLYDGCLCLLGGCEDSLSDCPELFLCVEPSCIPEEPGCEAGEGEIKVCFPNNW